MIIAPSTSRPKSSAPRLIRFALTRVCTIPVTVISMANGITRAVRNAARMLPSNKNSTTITRMAPSSRFVQTVSSVLSTSFVRSYTACASIPFGKPALISFSFSPTAYATVRLFSPININTVLITTSRPFCVAAPVRRPLPFSISATSPTVMAEPSTEVNGMRATASRLSTCPGKRSNN